MIFTIFPSEEAKKRKKRNYLLSHAPERKPNPMSVDHKRNGRGISLCIFPRRSRRKNKNDGIRNSLLPEGGGKRKRKERLRLDAWNVMNW